MIQCVYCFELQEHPLLVGLNKSGGENRIKVSTSGVTTGMLRHFEHCKRGPKSQEKLKGGIDKFVSTSRPGLSMTNDQILDKVLKFFISGNIAFNQADNPYFRDLISEIRIDGSSVPVNRDNMKSRLTQQSEKGREELLATLMRNESKVSLALDCWSSRNNMAFLGTYSL